MSEPQTIVEFLTARYDEAESGIRQALRTEDYGVSQFDLADIAAKRRIVEKAATYDPLRDTGNVTANAGVIVAKMVYDVVLRELANPYADHPDYREEWRVDA